MTDQLTDRGRKLNYWMHRAKDYLMDEKYGDHEARVLALDCIHKGLDRDANRG